MPTLGVRHATRDKIMMATPLFILFIIIPLIGMIWAGVFIWKKGSKAGKWVLMLPGIFLALLFVHYFFVHWSSPERLYEATYVSQPSVQPGRYEKLSQEYEADVYPSKVAAVRSLGRRMETPIQEIREYQKLQGHPQNTPMKIVRNNTDSELLDAFGEGIKEHNVATITYAADKADIQKGEVYFTLEFKVSESRAAPWNPGKIAYRGIISASAETAGSSTTIHAQYAEKPWVENFDHFRAWEARPKNQTWIFAQSRTSTHKGRYAHDEAIEDGMRQLQPLVESRMQKYLPRSSWFGSSRPSSQEVQEFLRRELQSRIVVDRFEQRFQQHGTTIWWEGMLINASERNLELLAEQCAQGKDRQEWSWARTAGSAAGLLGLICIVYLFLNLATRGYYVWVLRGGVVVVILIVVVVILKLSA